MNIQYHTIFTEKNQTDTDLSFPSLYQYMCIRIKLYIYLYDMKIQILEKLYMFKEDNY